MDSVAARYYVQLRDQSGTLVAVFDDWMELSFGWVVNDIGYYTFSINGLDERVAAFELDGLIEVFRSVPGCGLGYYREFAGLQTEHRLSMGNNGEIVFTSNGVTAEELLARRIVAYDAGTIRADKDGPAETVMKEYVTENCTNVYDFTVVGRLDSTYLPGFSVEGTTGAGAGWKGSMAYENLLDALQDIAETSGIDFFVEVGEGNQRTYIFRTKAGQVGSNRTMDGLNSITGYNRYGNVPVIFSAQLANISKATLSEDHSKEANIVVMLGKGDVSTRDTFTRVYETGRTLSPWNSREVSRSGGNQEYDYQFIQAADDELVKAKWKETLDFTPLQTPVCLYGKHYFFGDRVTIQFGGITRNKRITGVDIKLDDQGEHISLKMDKDA